VSKQPLTVSLVSLGCPKNLVDSEKMLAHLAENGCVVGTPMEEADVIVVNTCGFLKAARDESLEAVAEAVACKYDGRTRRVVLAGCLVQRDAEELFETVPGIDAIVGVNDRDRLIEAVAGRRKAIVSPCEGEIHDDTGRFRLTPRHTAYLRISEGCDHRCTYCTIPDIRGPFRSKAPEAVLAEARELVADGAVELNVIGQDTTNYGADMGEDRGLPMLLRELNTLEGLRWIRLLYTHPRGFSDELIAAMTECEHVVPYVDLPLQHVSDEVLRRMGRGTKRRDIEALLGRLRDVGMAVRTTFIVGFPGETEARFDELLRFVEGFRFDALGVFKYSPETDTPAAEMSDQVPDEVKSRRAEEVMLAQQKIAFEANRKLVGSSVTVLVDGREATDRCVGRHCGQAPDIDGVCYLTRAREAGRFVTAAVVDWDEYDLVVEPPEDTSDDS